VTYNQSNSKTLERTLVTEIPFKASDVQPMAPEYSFFIANSKKVSDQGDIVDSSVILGDPISLNRDVSKAKADFYSDSPPAGQFIIHNIPSKNESTAVASIVKEKIDYTALDGTRIPGMVRVNCDYTPSNNKVTQIRSFFGIVGQPELTEFNKLMMPFNDMKGDLKNNFDTIVSFCWEDRDGKRTPAKRYHDIELPVIFDTDCGVPTPQEPGIKHIIDFVKSSGFQIISVPTLLFGTCHMEYPLGLVAEGPIDTIFSRTRVFVKLHGELSLLPPDFDELSEVSYNYENVTNYANSSENAYAFDGSDKPESRDLNRASGFGMTGAKTSPICGYNKNQPWSCNDDPKYCPANCYDTLQYVKKATKYYESEKEFLADLDKDVAKGGLLGEGGYKEFHGVYYVKCETLNLGTFKYKGNGLIVSKSDIIIKGNITRDDNDTTSTLGIISRNGSLEFKGGAEKIMASCFSNNPPRNSSPKLSIYGNLVCNTFKRDSFGVDTYIYYNNSINSVTPFALHRKVGKFEPKRYAVAFADNWSKFSYEQKKEE
ncbi:MAG: hypothetical protein J6Z11_02010, partial [Candidatus Riflebacteria bacterium]|nr:hypothetical protein [Candidatus Riflebacteria bacterium]